MAHNLSEAHVGHVLGANHALLANRGHLGSAQADEAGLW
jgi:hypothetical protein